DSASIMSAGARSLVGSLYSLTIGGERVQKRRRPQFSDLGAPEWHPEDKVPIPDDMPGTVSRSDIGAYTVAHGTVLPLRLDDKSHWLSLILYNHAAETSLAAMYHNEAKICGELRLSIEKPKSISSLDIWLAAIAPNGQLLSLTANLWSRHKGDPKHPGAKNPSVFKDKFPSGTYVFPFELPAFPRFVQVSHPDHENQRGMVALPPSGKVKFTCGVGVRRDSVGGINEDMDMILQYIPLTRNLPKAPSPFPFLTSREEWPFKRESIGGWVLTPFGGRGRIGTDIVEVEGILGVQDPAVFQAGQTVDFVLLLWSKSADAITLLAQPAAISVGHYKADLMPSSEALRPRSQSRQTRTLERTADGRIWLAESGRPAQGESAPPLVYLSHVPELAPPSSPKTPTLPSRMQSFVSADDPEEEENQLEAADQFDDAFGDTEQIVRLEGEIVIPPSRPVSYRYTELGREYSLQLHITHPQYAHISPTGAGLVAEVPLWITADRPIHSGPVDLNADADYLASLPLKGATIPVGPGAIRWPKSVGERARHPRGGKPKLGQAFLGLRSLPGQSVGVS
ncbi:unnamed protein product, partial [Mycena citricolor]